MIVEKDLKGVFKWIVVDENSVIVDPVYMGEYQNSIKGSRVPLFMCPHKIIMLVACISAAISLPVLHSLCSLHKS